jgi:hypothetical protein
LRLTDKRIRALERERVRRGVSFEKVYRRYAKKRVAHAAARIAKLAGVGMKEAREIRRQAIKEHTSYVALIKKPEVAPSPTVSGLPIEGTNYLELCKLVMDIREDISKGRTASGFQVDLSFREFEYQGDIADLVLQDVKEHGMNEVFPDDTAAYWVLDTGLVSGVLVPNLSLSVVIATDRTEVVSGEEKK